MLGRVMNEVLSDEELGRLLTGKMSPRSVNHCFWRVAALDAKREVGVYDRYSRHFMEFWRGNTCGGSIGGPWFDALCDRFGTERIATLIRNRALKILAVRELSKARSVSVNTVEV